VEITERTQAYGCIGLWGPNARQALQSIAEDPAGLAPCVFPFASFREITIAGISVLAFRISYVGEQGWELHFKYDDGLALWDALFAQGVTPVGIETYASSRRLEKSLRLQNADLLTDYNLLEAGLARPKVKPVEFHGQAAYLKQRAQAQQPALLCTLVMDDNVDASGVARYPLGNCPIIDPNTGDVLVDELGRRSYTTSIAYGPSVGKNIMLAYLPWDFCREGQSLRMEYFNESYPVSVAAVGYRPLYDPENLKPRS